MASIASGQGVEVVMVMAADEALGDRMLRGRGMRRVHRS
jgi:hypothetical protein